MAQTMKISIRNLKNEDKLPHQLALLEGDINTEVCEGQLDVIIDCESSSCIDHAQDTGDSNIVWPVRNGRFKAIVPLHLGKNNISLRFECTVEFVTLFYEPPDTGGHFLRPLYLICNDDEYEGRFQGPEEPSRRTATVAFQKIDLGIKLLQLFVAESLHRHILRRKTFAFDAEAGLPLCKLFRLTTVTTGEAGALPDQKLWCLVRDELAKDPMLTNKKRSKFIAFVSFTRYANPDKLPVATHEEKIALTKAHCALGGGGLALLSTGCLHTWAARLSELVPRFTDCNEIDIMSLLDDSQYRRTYWACYATILGAAGHELGHIFDFCHAERGLMSADFGQIHKMFILPELLPESKTPDKDVRCAAQSEVENGSRAISQNLNELMFNGVSGSSLISQVKLKKHLGNDWEAADFRRPEAIWLRYHKWLNPPHPKNTGKGPQLRGLQIRARHGLRIVILAGQGNDGGLVTRRHYEFLKGRGVLTFQLDKAECLHLNEDPSSLMTIMAEDCYGNTMIVPVRLKTTA